MTMCRKESQPCYAPATLGQGEVESGKREISVGEELGYRGKWRVAFLAKREISFPTADCQEIQKSLHILAANH